MCSAWVREAYPPDPVVEPGAAGPPAPPTQPRQQGLQGAHQGPVSFIKNTFKSKTKKVKVFFFHSQTIDSDCNDHKLK